VAAQLGEEYVAGDHVATIGFSESSFELGELVIGEHSSVRRITREDIDVRAVSDDWTVQDDLA
jgi:hypothetical protein